MVLELWGVQDSHLSLPDTDSRQIPGYHDRCI